MVTLPTNVDYNEITVAHDSVSTRKKMNKPYLFIFHDF